MVRASRSTSLGIEPYQQYNSVQDNIGRQRQRSSRLGLSPGFHPCSCRLRGLLIDFRVQLCVVHGLCHVTATTPTCRARTSPIIDEVPSDRKMQRDHIPTRRPVIPTEKHKVEQDKRLPKHERATKRDGRGRRESNHPEANAELCRVTMRCLAFGLGVACSTCAFHLFICSRDSIETDVIAIAIAGSESITRTQNWGNRESRVYRCFRVRSKRFGMKRLADRSSRSILIANRSIDLRRHRANRTFISPS